MNKFRHLFVFLFFIISVNIVLAYNVNIQFYDENTFFPLGDVTITDSNGSTYTSDVNGLWAASLAGAKELEISKTGYGTRNFNFYFNADANYNFLLSSTGLDSNIEFLVLEPDNTVWSNKYLMFKNNLFPDIESDLNQTIDYGTIRCNHPEFYQPYGVKVEIGNQDMLLYSVRTVNGVTAKKVTVAGPDVIATASVTGNVATFVPNILLKANNVYSINAHSDGATYSMCASYTNVLPQIKTHLTYLVPFGATPEYAYNIAYISVYSEIIGGISNSDLTNSSGYTYASIFSSGGYNAELYNATGDLNYTYEKTLVTVNQPKDEKTLTAISPYDIYVGGLLQYNLINQTESSVAFNIFAGTTDYYTFTAVDYNATVADQKYIPKSYFVKVPMGTGYESAVTYTPYLLLKTDGIVPKVIVIDQLNRTIPNAQVYVSKYIGGVLTIVESGNTYSNGVFNFSAYPLDNYYLTVYFNGINKGTYSVQPRESADTFYIKIDRSTSEEIAQRLLISADLTATSRYQTRDANINVLGKITSNLNYITDYNVNLYERGNLVYSSNTIATGTSIDINKFIDVNLIPASIHNGTIKVIVNYSVAGETGSKTFSESFIITNNPNVVSTLTSAKTELGQPLSLFVAILVVIMLIAILVFSGIINDPAILAVFGALVLGVFMFLGFLDLGVSVLGMDIGKFAYFLGLMATLYFAFFGGR